MKQTNGVIGGFATLAAIMAWGVFWNGLTLHTLWGWFAVDTLGVSEIGLMQAFGLWLLVVLVRGSRSDKVSPEKIATAVLAAPFLCAILVGAGWLIKAWV